MGFTITQHGKVIERHHNVLDAEFAFWILTAHELKNGRVANLELDLRQSNPITPPDRLALPAWAQEILARHLKVGK